MSRRTKAYRVIIIGAGLAGLAAGYYLKRKGISFVLIESRNRVGGRVRSCLMDKQDQLVVELGAEWIGNSHTRIRELCAALNLQLDNNRMETHMIYRKKYFKSDEWDYSENWKEKLNYLLKQYGQLNTEDKQQLDNMDWWRYLLNNGCNGRDLDIHELADNGTFGESIRYVSALSALSGYVECSEAHDMDLKVKGGNSRLVTAIADAIGRENIFLQHTVQRIVQKNKVVVQCDNSRLFESDQLICTVPTFSLSKIQWDPVLPAEKVNAINELQYARINKNALLFRSRFWKDESFDMITDTPADYFYHATKNQPSKKGALISYTIGDNAAIVANQTNRWRANMIDDALKPFFSEVKGMLEKQTNCYWGNDEFSMGAYAQYGRGQWNRVMPVLTKPFLYTYFAGEHLAHLQGFMEGAVITGEEAAEKI